MPSQAPAREPGPWLVEAAGISKSFPGVRALADVDLQLAPGEVLCVVGENGAGKSTLMKILGGVYTADAGEVRVDGRAVSIESVEDARRLGITLIHQELNLAHSLDVAGNVFLGREPRFGGWLGLLDRRMYTQAETLIRRLGLDCSARTSVGRLAIGQQQLVEIARVLCFESRVLIMDEPTSSLTQRETDRLFEVVADLKRAGVSVLYISHRLAEVQQIADRVTVLRDGRNAGELARHEISHDAMVRLMVGRELGQFFHRPSAIQGEPGDAEKVLEARGLRIFPGQRQPIDFAIHRGEIVGLAGLMGAGRTELAEALFGIRPLLAGSLRVDGRPVAFRKPSDAIDRGIFLVPENRRQHGLLLLQSIRRNISLPSMDRVSRAGLVLNAAERTLAQRMCGQLQVRATGIGQPVGLLSGGNQQKVVLARWLARSPRVLILDEPTRGIDVGAKDEIYALMRNLAASGVGILMVSSDLEEVLGVSDRVLVMHQGELNGELTRNQLTEQAVMNLATGGRKAP